MYLPFFGFTKEPFRVTPDPEFLFLSKDHREALAAVIYGVEQHKGFVLITGDVGVGKTTILRSYLALNDRKKLLPIYIFNPIVSFENLVRSVLRELGKETIPETLYDMVALLHETLVSECVMGRTVVLIIDEAQKMPIETLENIRLLSNLETAKGKLIQIVFSAQTEFEKILERYDLRQLKQRIAVKATIHSLSSTESGAYIYHRLSKAGACTNSVFFDKKSIRLIVKAAKGAPRMINILCDNCLITSYGYRKKKVTGSIAYEVIADLTGNKHGITRWQIMGVTVSVAILCTIAFSCNSGVLLPTTSQSAPQLTDSFEQQPLIQASEGQQSSVPIEVSNKRVKDDPGIDAVVTVKRGDTLASLISRRYGHVSRELISHVVRSNSFIRNVDLINAGEKIVFPAIKGNYSLAGAAHGVK